MGGRGGLLAVVGTIPLWFEAHPRGKSLERTGAHGGAAEMLQAASEVDLLVVVLEGSCSGHGLGVVLVLGLVLDLVFGSARWQLLENLPCFRAVDRRNFS